MFALKNLQQAISLAKLQELAVDNAQKRGKMFLKGNNTLPLLSTPKVPLEFG